MILKKTSKAKMKEMRATAYFKFLAQNEFI